MTEDADVGFHVYCMNGTQKVDVIPWERVPSHMVMEEGMAVCTRTDTRNSPLIGCYSIQLQVESFTDYVEFDNSYSYLKSKKVWFTLVVDPPIITGGKASETIVEEVEKAFNKYYGSKQMVQVRW